MASALERYLAEEEAEALRAVEAAEAEQAAHEAAQAEEDALRRRLGEDLYLQYKRMGAKEKLAQKKKLRAQDAAKRREEEEERARRAAAEELRRKTKSYSQTGAVYVGDSLDDGDGATFEPHGTGTWYWPDGDKQYEGEWWKGRKHGRGTYYWRNGDSWTGQFRNDEMHGCGAYVPADTGRPRQCIYKNSYRVCWLEDIGLGKRVELKEPGGARFPGGLYRKATVTRVVSHTVREISFDGTAPKRQRVDFNTAEFRVLDGKEAQAYLLHTPLHTPPSFELRPKDRRRSSASVAANPAAFRRRRGKQTTYTI